MRWRILAVIAALCTALPLARGQNKLDQIVERLDLSDVSMADALRILAEESGVNMVASEEAAKKTVTAFVQNVTVRQAIELIVKAYGLWYREDESSGSVRVLTAKEVERDLSTFRDEKTTVFTLFYPNALDVAYAIRNLYGDRLKMTVDRQHMNDEYEELSQRFQRFDLLDKRGTGFGTQNGGTNGSSLSSGGYLNNGQYGNQFQGIGGSSGYGSSQPPVAPPVQDRNRPDLTPDQIATLEREAQANGTTDSTLYDRARGEKTSIYATVIQRNNMIAVRSSDRGAMIDIEKLVKALDVPTPQVLLEVKILSLDLGDDFESTVEGAYSDGHTGASVGSNGILDTLVSGSGGFVYQYVNDKFMAKLSFLQERRRVNTVATPLLLVANNEVARLFVGEEVPIVTNISSQTVQNNNQTVTAPNTTFQTQPVGTTLILTPNVNADRTVTLRVLEETSSVNRNGGSIPIITSDGAVTDQKIDTVRSRTVSGTVVAKDGLTLALGGLIEEGITDLQRGVPGLMDLPLIGFLFRNESKLRSHTELVVLIRPYVLFTASEGQKMSEALSDRLSLNPSKTTMNPMGVFDANEPPRPTLGKDPLKEMFKMQSGLPDGK